MRSANLSASSSECVTSRTVGRASTMTSANSSCIWCASAASSDTNGSSSNSNPDFDAKLKQALSLIDVEKRREVMKDVEQILQDSGVIIQPFWQKLYSHTNKKVKNYGVHQTFEMDLQNVWLDG